MAPTFFETPEAFRAWLEENHETAIELSVGFRKKVTGRASITWPQAVGDYGKYGLETVGAAASTWFAPPGLAVSGNSASFTITDGGVGDGDAADGVIVDPTGPLAAAPPVVVPTLSAWALALLAGLLGLLGRRRWRAA